MTTVTNQGVKGSKGVSDPLNMDRRTLLLVGGTIATAATLAYVSEKGQKEIGNRIEALGESQASPVTRYVTDPRELISEISPGVYDLGNLQAYTAELGGKYAPIHENGVVTSVVNRVVPNAKIGLGYDGTDFYAFLLGTDAYMNKYKEIAPRQKPGNIRLDDNVEFFEINPASSKEILPGLHFESKRLSPGELEKVLAIISPDEVYGEMIMTENLKVA